jgi:hypothetical protein
VKLLNALARLLGALNLSAICLSLSAILLGHTIQITNGFYNPIALTWLTWSLAFALAGMLLQRISVDAPKLGLFLVGTLLVAGIGWQIQLLLTTPPGAYVNSHASMRIFRGAVVAQGVFVALGLTRLPFIRRAWFPAVLAASLLLGVWMIKASPNPYIDVTVVHKEAIEALLHHKDPYRISFPNIYGADARYFYNPEAIMGSRLAFAYPYPPASLLFAVPGHVLFGDYRYSEVILLVLGAALMGFTRQGLVGKLAACLLLTTPRIWFVIEQGWTEPIPIFLLALTVFLLVRRPIAAGWAAGLLVVTKQYMGFAGLAVVRMIFIRARQWPWTALGVVLAATAVTLPFILWHPNAFMRNVVWLQTLEPFRPDSLSYLSWAARHGMGNGSYLWAVGAAVLTAGLTMVTTRNTATGFATATALTMFVMFAFGSKAFCNYYFFVIGALCCAMAALPQLRGEDSIR